MALRYSRKYLFRKANDTVDSEKGSLGLDFVGIGWRVVFHVVVPSRYSSNVQVEPKLITRKKRSDYDAEEKASNVLCTSYRTEARVGVMELNLIA